MTLPAAPLPSPYSPGELPAVLAGRGQQVSDAETDLAVMATYGRFLGRIRVDIGSRGVGKTSLLKTLSDRAAEAGAITAWVTARGDESLIASIVAALNEGLDAIGIDVEGRSAIAKRLRTLSLELGIGVAKAGVEVDIAPGATADQRSASATFGQFLSTASAAARDRGSAGLCLLVDEIQAAPRADLRTLAYAWQELQGRPDAPAAVTFAAGLPNSPDVLTAAVTFSERFAFRTLERLGDDDARFALVEPAAQHDVAWTDGLLIEVLDRAQGYPFFLQLYGDAVWSAARPQPGGRLTRRHLAAAQDRVEAELDTMFRARWAKASPAERRMLAAMADLTDADGPVRRGDVAIRMGATSNDLSVPRRSLLDKGLIEVAARGSLRFTVPGFAAFVRDEVG